MCERPVTEVWTSEVKFSNTANYNRQIVMVKSAKMNEDAVQPSSKTVISKNKAETVTVSSPFESQDASNDTVHRISEQRLEQPTSTTSAGFV